MLTFTYDTSEVEKEIDRVIDRLEDQEAIHAIAGEVLLDNMLERYQNEEAPDGSSWEPHAPLTLLLRRGRGGILRESGELFGSLHMTSSSSRAEVGTNLDHPKVFTHQYGAHIEPVRAKMLKVPTPPGANAPIFLKEANIPARPFVGLGTNDADDVREELIAYFEE